MTTLYLDIETTGLKNEYCQVLSIGAVYDYDESLPLVALPWFYRVIYWDKIIGQPRGIQMNADLLTQGKPLKDVMHDWNLWRPKEKVVVGGKNVHFDLSFLHKLPDFKLNHYHRFVDPSMLYWKGGVPPSLSECIQDTTVVAHAFRHHLIEEGNSHHALYDALLTCEAVRCRPK